MIRSLLSVLLYFLRGLYVIVGYDRPLVSKRFQLSPYAVCHIRLFQIGSSTSAELINGVNSLIKRRHPKFEKRATSALPVRRSVKVWHFAFRYLLPTSCNTHNVSRALATNVVNSTGVS